MEIFNSDLADDTTLDRTYICAMKDRDLSSNYRLIWIAAIVFTVISTVAAFAFSILTAISARSPICADQLVLEGYKTGVVDLFEFPLFCAVVFAFLFRLVHVVMKRESTIQIFKSADSLKVFEFLSMPIGYGIFGFLVPILTLLFMVGITAGYSVVRYTDISHFCWPAESRRVFGNMPLTPTLSPQAGRGRS
jgi:hypothetical protein